ncbi:hypothetical protein [Burkholderia multivorans]|uniref:hypothetical protein n=1 Tax=Burkholderia multivorans TaxID=87883 RepID=UPI00123B012C|nr:hypothetical protein [Burkholderia multivorans]QET29529.1 hypothetical protein FOB31_06780 [Burkholderia multivorans]QET39901.1 hypothetical protein FOB30_19600 [Burkholderia multivorans]
MREATFPNITNARHDLQWLGDSLLADQLPVAIQVSSRDGRIVSLSLRDTLACANRIDTSGLIRIVSALEHKSASGAILADDLAAWRADRERVIALLSARKARMSLHSNHDEDYLPEESA